MKLLVNKIQYFHFFTIIISLIIHFFILVHGIEYRRTEFRSNNLNEQWIFSRVVKEYVNEGHTIAVWGWWQAPEISFLSGGLRFINLVIYTKLHEQLEPKSASELINKLGTPIYISQNNNYYLFATKEWLCFALGDQNLKVKILSRNITRTQNLESFKTPFIKACG